ncbi:MAG: deoxyguanosinetriphosphate triphosphohydrolase, partial [Gammaproteobacteria bacterium]|nr:deoxyguanosinetriphosphate triphosphohydrolase [Gammaproteobacteria bacterium]
VIGNAKLLARKRIFESPQRHRTELGASAILETILDGFVPAALERVGNPTGEVSFKAQKYLVLMGTHQPEANVTAYQALCHTMDFIAGMTDKYAVTLARQLKGELL